MDEDFRECGDVDTSDIGKNSWIVKVPRDLFEEWNKTGQGGGVPVGDVKVVHEKPLVGKPIVKMKVITRNVEYVMEPQQIPKPLFIFKKESHQMAISDSIHRLFHLRRTTEVTKKDYTDRIKKFSKMKNKRKHRMQRHDEHDMGLMSKTSKTRLRELRRKKKRVVRDKIKKEDLQQILFSMFRRKERWKFDDIVKETKQPVKHLRDVLRECAFKHLSGINRSLWEVKPEYRDKKDDEVEEVEEKDEWVD